MRFSNVTDVGLSVFWQLDLLTRLRYLSSIVANTNTNDRVDYLVNSLYSLACVNIIGILYDGIFEILIITEFGETYCGIFALYRLVVTNRIQHNGSYTT